MFSYMILFYLTPHIIAQNNLVFNEIFENFLDLHFFVDIPGKKGYYGLMKRKFTKISAKNKEKGMVILWEKRVQIH